MNGLQGLAQSINDRDTGTRELATLERMDARMQQDKQAEQLAEQQQQLFYEKMYETADGMLEKDRAKINKRIIQSQQQIRKHLSDTGGSMKDFMAQGGISLTNNIKNQVIRSDEAIQYQENKKNLAKILEAQEKGLGHLLSPRDLQSLKEHQENPDGGPITYSGMMAQVEIPPAANFDYGKEISPLAIMSYDANMVKILGNYKIAYPDRPELDPNNPNDRAQIISFMKEMGYGGMGSNTTRIKEQYALQKAREKQAAKDNTKKDGKHSFMYAYSEGIKMMPEGLTIKNLKENYGDDDLVKKLMKEKGVFNDIIGDKFEERARRREASYVDDSFLDFGEAVDYLAQDMMGLRDSYKLALTQKDQDLLAKEVFGTFMDESGKVKNYRPSSNDYAADGTTITDNDRNDADNYEGDYTILGVTTALKSKVKNGKNGKEESVLLVNAYDDDGGFDKKSTDKLYEGVYGENPDSDVAMTTVVALRNEEGDIIYKEVDVNKAGIQKAMSNSIASTDDITSIADQRDETKAVRDQVQALNSQQEIELKGARQTLENSVFSDPLFRSEASYYDGTGSGGQQNRANMMKAFYMASDFLVNAQQGKEQVSKDNVQKAVDSEVFSASAEALGMGDMLKDYSQGNTEYKIIDTWLAKANEGADRSAQQANMQVAEKWKQILKMM
jgi:hypothetical protein